MIVLQHPGFRCVSAALLASLACAAPPPSRADPGPATDARMEEIRLRVGEMDTLLAAETNAVLRAAAEKRRALLLQELANTERRRTLEQREQPLGERRSADPLAELRKLLIAAQGDPSAPQRDLQALDTQYRQIRADRERGTERLVQLRAGIAPDARAVAEAERALRFESERLELVLLERRLAEGREALATEAARIAERIRATVGIPPILRTLRSLKREIEVRERQREDLERQVRELDGRREEVRAGLELAQAHAAQIDEAIVIRREMERIDRTRSRFAAWLSSSDEEKDRVRAQQLIRLMEQQAQAADAVGAVARQLDALRAGEIEWLRFEHADLRRRYLERARIPALAAGAILVLRMFLHFMVIPVFARGTRRVALRRGVGNLAALALLGIVVGFFLADLRPYRTAIGVAAVALAIALRDLWTAAAGRLALAAGGKMRIGDRVEIDGVRGDVLDIQLLRTTLRELGRGPDLDEPTGRVVLVPNSVVFREKIVNSTHMHPVVRDRMDVTVPPETPATAARDTLYRVLTEETREMDGTVRRAGRRMWRTYGVEEAVGEPRIVTEASDRGVTFRLLYGVDVRRRAAMRQRLRERIVEEFGREPDLRTALLPAPRIASPEAG